MLAAAGGGDTVSTGISVGPVVFAGTGNGTISPIVLTSDAATEIVTVTFTNAADYSVAGSFTGAGGVGTVGDPFTGFSGHVAFTIFAGPPAFIAGDTIRFTIVGAQTVACMINAEDGPELQNPSTGRLWGQPVSVTSDPLIVTVRTGSLAALKTGLQVVIRGLVHTVDRIYRKRDDRLTHFLAYEVRT